MKRYNTRQDLMIAYGNGHINQKELEAELTRFSHEEKSKKAIKAGANLQSQWGRVVTNEQRLIDNGHYMKTSERAKLDYMREQYRKAKKENKDKVIILVKKGK